MNDRKNAPAEAFNRSRYRRNAPVEAFRTSLEIYGQMIGAAVEQGYTEEQAVDLLKVWALLAVANSIDEIG